MEKENGFHLELRPKTFDEVRGNVATVKVLKEMLSRPTKPHSYLLYGPTGCGKTTIARLIAKELGCHSSELYEMNTANTRGIDSIREVIEFSHYVPTMGKVKVFLFDEAHQITGVAAEALLKILEDTPPYVYIILATTNPEKLLATVKGRCERFQVHRLKDHEMMNFILDVIEKKGIVLASDKIIERVHTIADGCPREALLLLEKICNAENEDEANKALDDSSGSKEDMMEICKFLLTKGKNWLYISEKLKANEDEVEDLRRMVLGFMQTVLLNQNPKNERERLRASEVIEIFSHSFWEGGKPKLIQSFFKAFMKMQELV